jgi:orotidine-5'-phosphate decarboxylase
MPVSAAPPVSVRERLIVALDLPDVDEARRMIDRLGDDVAFYKIGYRLAFSGGLVLIEELAARGADLFLDLKLHDIGNTVREGVAALAGRRLRFLTVHAYPQTMRGAVAGRAEVSGSGLGLLGVTALTSYDEADLEEAGYRLSVRELVGRRAAQAVAAGLDGVVCAPGEAPLVREAAGGRLLIVTPGVRPRGMEAGDQKRALTPGEALRLGADHLVVGRPILAASDPRGAARAILDEIAGAS